jgi:hypothetical protein
MKTKKPETRIEASAPEAVQHLTAEQQEALETGHEAEHAHGAQREQLSAEAQELGEKSDQ